MSTKNKKPFAPTSTKPHKAGASAAPKKMLGLKIHNIKNIKDAEINIPFEKGIYGFVGENGCGKSTIMLAASLAMMASSAKTLLSCDYDDSSFVKISLKDSSATWVKRDGKFARQKKEGEQQKGLLCKGFYEGSIFYGSRFDDYALIDKFMDTEDFQNHLIDADKYISETLGYILHNDINYYKGLKKVRNMAIAEKHGFKHLPYFIRYGEGRIISQYRMSSGESMLISLFDFINNLTVNNNHRGKLLFLIDEIELALHPSAIDRLGEKLAELVDTSKQELVIYFSTHSAELVRRIPPNNLYLLENDNGVVTAINPCYPNYAIRSLYAHNGYDFLILVEDELAKALVEKVIFENQLDKSKLWCVLPVGGWSQMAKIHHYMTVRNVLGIGRKIISIYDGDVAKNPTERNKLCEGVYKDLPKTFLPILSVEKYLLNKLVTHRNAEFMRFIGDRYFKQKQLTTIVQDYQNECAKRHTDDRNGKILYETLLENLRIIDKDEEWFIAHLCDDIYRFEDMTAFVNALRELMS